MSKSTPIPGGKKPDTETNFAEPSQDESGKTAAPQSTQGPQRPQVTKPPANEKREEPRPM